MNKWECEFPGCKSTAVGCGGAVGLRAIGWYFKPGPKIFCPNHRPDKEDCSSCIAEMWAWFYQHLIEPSYFREAPGLVMDHLHRPVS